MADSSKFHLHHGATGAAIAVRVIPSCPQNRISDIGKDGSVTIQVTTKDANEKVNRELIQFLSDILSVPPARIEIVAGEGGPDKLITVLNIDSAALQERIFQAVKR